MSDSEASGGIANAVEHGAASTLTPAAIDAILADFRAWLTEPMRSDSSTRAESSVDLFTLLAQFTALRHEVNMQTRAVRAAVEQNADLAKLATAAPAPEPAADIRPVAKALIDIADALSLSLRQMEKFAETAEPLLVEAPETPRPGLFARLFGAKPAPRRDFAKLKQLAAAAADGYSLSLRRVERLFPDLTLEPIDCEGEPFDPETMEAVEVVGETGRPAGIVLEVVRPGYRLRGKVFRFAQVKVAR